MSQSKTFVINLYSLPPSVSNLEKIGGTFQVLEHMCDNLIIDDYHEYTTNILEELANEADNVHLSYGDNGVDIYSDIDKVQLVSDELWAFKNNHGLSGCSNFKVLALGTDYLTIHILATFDNRLMSTDHTSMITDSRFDDGSRIKNIKKDIINYIYDHSDVITNTLLSRINA